MSATPLPIPDQRPMSATALRYVVTRCGACKVQAEWDQRDRFSWGWFHAKPGPNCSHGQYLDSSHVETITLEAPRQGVTSPHSGSQPPTSGIARSDPPSSLPATPPT